MKVLIVEPGKYPREADIEHTLEAEQAVVGGTIEAVGGAGAAGIGDGVGARSEIDPNAPPSNPSNPNNIIICGDAEVTAKAGSQILDAEVPAIGGSYGEVPTEDLSNEEHKVTCLLYTSDAADE